MRNRTIVGGTTAAGVVGYALAVLLARAADYAERIEHKKSSGHLLSPGPQ